MATRGVKGRKLVDCENGFCKRQKHFTGTTAHLECLEDLESRRYENARPVEVQPTKIRSSLNPEKTENPEQPKVAEYSANTAPNSLGSVIRPKDFNLEGRTIGITPRVRPIQGVNHYQIVALKPVEVTRLGKVIPAGTRGGWVASPSKISKNSWVDENSMVGENIEVMKDTYIVNSTLENKTDKPLKISSSLIKDVKTPNGEVSGVIKNADISQSYITGPVVIASVNNSEKNDIKVYNSLLNKVEIAGEKTLVDSCALSGVMIGGVKNPKDTIILRGVKAMSTDNKPTLKISASRVSITSNMETRKIGGMVVTADPAQKPELTLENVTIKGDAVQIKGNHAIKNTVITGTVEHPARINNSTEKLEIQEAIINPGSLVKNNTEFSVSGNTPGLVDVTKQETLFAASTQKRTAENPVKKDQENEPVFRIGGRVVDDQKLGMGPYRR